MPENSPRAWAEMTNAVQRFALDNSRLRIPILYGADGVHGHGNVLTATMFPHQTGLGATWDPPAPSVTFPLAQLALTKGELDGDGRR